MHDSALDVSALLVTLAVAVVVAASMILAHRGDNHRRAWIVAGIVTLVLCALGVIDIMRVTPRETRVSTVVTGVALCVLGALGMVRGTRRVRPWLRWLMTVATALVLLLGGLLIGATLVSRLAPF